MIYTRGVILLWVCEILLGGDKNSLSGILLLEEKEHVKNQSSGNKIRYSMVSEKVGAAPSDSGAASI